MQYACPCPCGEEVKAEVAEGASQEDAAQALIQAGMAHMESCAQKEAIAGKDPAEIKGMVMQNMHPVDQAA